MHIAQIIVFGIVLILDFYLTFNHISYLLFTNKVDKRGFMFFGHVFRFIFVWMIILALTLELNKYISNKPCPELEKLENVYKMK
jgi:hypothetical protein